MQEIIFKKKISKTKMDALIQFLKSWDIDAEVKTKKEVINESNEFSLSVGLWKDYEVDAKELRKQAWSRK
jgi:hypothetical protein